jgi:hypothetical protein
MTCTEMYFIPTAIKENAAPSSSQDSRTILLANIKEQQLTKIARIAGNFF